MAHPTMSCYKAAMRVVRYLKGSLGQDFFFSGTLDLQLLGSSDVDWGGCVEARRSISGYSFFLGHSLICWKSKKKTIISRSFVKAKYRGLIIVTCELQWITFLL